MAISEELLVKISIDADGAIKGAKVVGDGLKGLEKQTKQVAKTNKTAEQSFSKLGAQIVTLNQTVDLAGRAFNALVGPVKAVTGAFAEQESAELALANSLALTSGFTQEAFDDFSQFASQLQEVSTVGDETTLRLLGVAKSMKLTDDVAKDLVSAAADLSAATGKDLESAFQTLLKSTGGLAGELGEVLPEVKNLTAEQLKAGGAIELVGKQFEGFAEASTKSFAGSVKQLSNTVGDAFEEIGKVLVEGLDVKTVIQNIKDFASTTIATIQSMRPVFAGLASAFAAIDFAGLASNAQVLGVAIAAAFAPAIIPAGLLAAKIVLITASVAAVIASVDILVRALMDFENTGNLLSAAFKTIWEGIKLGFKELISFIISGIEKALSAVAGSFLDVGGVASSALTKVKDVQASLTQSITESGAAMEESSNRVKESISNVDTGLFGELFTQGKEAIAAFNEGFDETNQKLKTGADEMERFKDLAQVAGQEEVEVTVTQKVSKAAEDFSGAVSPVMGKINGVLDTVQGMINFIPQALDKVAGIFNSLTDLPGMIVKAFEGVVDAVRNFIVNFIPNIIQSLGDILDTIAVGVIEGIPDALLQLLDSLPSIIDGFIDRVPDIVSKLITGLIKAIPKLTIALVKEAPNVAFALAKALAIELPIAIVEGIVQALSEVDFGALFSGDFSFFDADKIEDDVTEGVKKLEETLSGATEELFAVKDLEAAARQEDIAKNIADTIKKGGEETKNLWDKFLGGLQGAWEFMVKFFEDVWNGALALLEGLWGVLETIWTDIIMPIVNFFVEGIQKAFTWVKENVIDPLATAVSDAFVWVVDNVITPLATAVSDAFAWVVDEILTPLATFVSDAFGGIFRFFTRTLRESVSNAFTWITDVFEDLPDNLTGALDDAIEFFKGLGDTILDAFDGVKNLIDVEKLKTAFKPLTDLFSVEGFKKIGEALAKPLKPFTDALKKFANAVSDLLDVGGDFLEDVFGLNKGGQVPKRFNAGGQVPVQMFATGGGVDTVPAMLTPGEFVVNRGAVQSLGLAAMNQINGGQLPASSGGGNQNFSFNVKIDTTQPIDEKFVRTRLMPSIKKEMKRNTLDGEFLVARQGLR